MSTPNDLLRALDSGMSKCHEHSWTSVHSGGWLQCAALLPSLHARDTAVSPQHWDVCVSLGASRCPGAAKKHMQKLGLQPCVHAQTSECMHRWLCAGLHVIPQVPPSRARPCGPATWISYSAKHADGLD